MDIKGILKLIASPTMLAGIGGYLGYKYGKRASISNKYVAGSVGVGAGWLVGKGLQQFVQQPQLPATQQPVPQVTDEEMPPGMGDYVNLNLDAPGLPPMALPPAQNLPSELQFDTSPGNVVEGEGSYGKTSYNVSGVEDAMNEAEILMEMEKKGNGAN